MSKSVRPVITHVELRNPPDLDLLAQAAILLGRELAAKEEFKKKLAQAQSPTIKLISVGEPRSMEYSSLLWAR